jgi:nucleoside-triphosphatase THEP1
VRYIDPVRRITIITGPRDSGKTRCAAALEEMLRAAGTPVGGVIAEADIHAGRKVGYAFRDVMTGGRMPYAALAVSAGGSAPVPGSGRGYTFLDAGLAFGRAAISRAVAARVAVLIVDEIGPLEMKGRGLWDAVRESAARFPGAMVLTTRPSLVEPLCAKLGVGDEDARVVAAAEGSCVLDGLEGLYGPG